MNDDSISVKSSNSSVSSRSKRIKKKVNPKLPVRKNKAPQRKSQFNRASNNEMEDEEDASETESIQQNMGLNSSQSMDYSSGDERFIGPISESERRRRVVNYLKKKYNKIFMKKFTYKCRK